MKWNTFPMRLAWARNVTPTVLHLAFRREDGEPFLEVAASLGERRGGIWQTFEAPGGDLSTVEFAIVALVLFILMLAVIEVARAFFVASALDETTRRGARWASRARCARGCPSTCTRSASRRRAVPRTSSAT